MRILAIALVAAMLLAAGCSRSQSTGPTASRSAPPPRAGQTMGSGQMMRSSQKMAMKGNLVLVSMTGKKIEMPTALPAGRTTFQAANLGHRKLGLEVKGQGMDRKVAEIAPGKTQSLEMELKPGRYQVMSPGSTSMRTALTVK